MAVKEQGESVKRKEKDGGPASEAVLYKIEIPANRSVSSVTYTVCPVSKTLCPCPLYGSLRSGMNVSLNHRYDLLCLEGLSLALKVFLGKCPIALYALSQPTSGQRERITVTKQVLLILIYVVRPSLALYHLASPAYHG